MGSAACLSEGGESDGQGIGAKIGIIVHGGKGDQVERGADIADIELPGEVTMFVDAGIPGINVEGIIGEIAGVQIGVLTVIVG